MPERPLSKPIISRLKGLVNEEELRSNRRFWDKLIKREKASIVKYALYRLLEKTARPSDYRRIYTFLGRLRTADHRTKLDNGDIVPKASTKWGGRVREVMIKHRLPTNGYKRGHPPASARNEIFETVEVILKRVHDTTAKTTINEINKIVKEWDKAKKEYEKTVEPINHVLLKPYAYAIGRDIVAMAKTDKPSVAEILGGPDGKRKTPRGQIFFRDLKSNHGVTREQLSCEMRALQICSGRRSTNILLLGVRNRKFLFLPLIDLE